MTTVNRNKSLERRGRIAHGLGAAVGTFFVATLALSIGVYLTGGDGVRSSSLGVDEMSLFNVTSEAAFGVASAVMSLVFGLIGAVTAAGAAIISLALGALGIVGGVVVAIGVVTGPLLLVAALVILVRRRFFPDVI